MTTAYTSLLGLALPVTGELSGTWGDTVNDYITQYLDSSVAGTQTISGSQTAVTLSKTTNAALSQVGSGATGSAQYNIINCTGNPASLLTITAPAASKTYLIINATSTSQSVKIVGTGPTTGVTLIAGEKALVAWNGSDFIKVATTAAAGGSNTQVQYNSGGNLAGSANLTFDGTNLTLGGGTANGVAYLNGSKVLTTGSALTFDGTNFATTGNITLSNNKNYQIQNTTGTAQVLLTLGNDNNVYMGQVSNPTAGAVFTYANQHIYVVGASEGMRLTSTGLGIGTSSPASRLQITSGAVRVTAESTTNSSNAGYRWSVKDSGGNVGNSGIYVEPTASINGRYFGFAVDDSTYAMVLNNSGNLGLGVTSVSSNISGSARVLGICDPATANLSSVRLGSGSTFASGNRMEVFASGSSCGLWGQDASPMVFYTNNTLRATLDSSGNLGLGVTPSAWSSLKALQINTQASVSADGTSIQVGTNAYYGSGGWTYIGSGYASNYYQLSGAHVWRTAASGTAGDPISFGDAKMTLDASGNLLVGGTAQLYGAAGRGLIQVSGSTEALLGFGTTGNTGLGYLYHTGTNFDLWNVQNGYLRFGTNNTERARISSDGSFRVKGAGTAGSTDAVQFAGSAPASSLILDSSGNLGLGATSTTGYWPSNLTQTAARQIISYSDATTNLDNANAGLVIFNSNSTAGSSSKLVFGANNSDPAAVGLAYISAVNSSRTTGYLSSSLVFATAVGGGGAGTGPTERARITSGGAFLAGKQVTTFDTDGVSLSNIGSNFSYTSSTVIAVNRNGTDGDAIGFYKAGVQVGSISVTGSATAYNTSSDYRLKDNPQPLTGSGAFIDALKPKTWDWKTGGRGVGFIAHEVQEVSPGSVVGAKDAVDEEGKPMYQAMEYGSAEFIANIIAELQSLRARVAALETK